MLAAIRKFAKSPYAAALFVLLILSFLVFGITDVFQSPVAKDSVIRAGDRQIRSAQFRQMFDNYRKQLEQQNNNQPIGLQEAVDNGLDKRMLETLAYSESFAALIRRIGIKPADQLVVEEIRKSPTFFDQITGRFDRATYQARLAENAMTEAQFETFLRDDLAQNHLISGLAAGLQTPRSYAAAMAAVSREGRTFEWFAVRPNAVPTPTTPTDAQLQAFIRSNAERFTKPEMRQITVVAFSTAALAPTIAVNPAEVQKRFDFEKDSLSTAEKRSVVQIPVKDQATGQQVAQRLRAGEDPAAVARSLGVQPVAYTDVPQTAIADRAVGTAAFGLKAGEVGGPIQGSLGLAVVKVNTVTPGKVPTLEEVRPRIEDSVRRETAQERIYDQVQKFEDAKTGGSNLAEAAKTVGATPITIPVPITAQGTNIAGQSANLPPKLLQEAFTLAETGESEVIDAGNGEYFALRVDKVHPQALATLQEVRALATQVYMLDEMRKRLEAKANELAARVRRGEPMQQVAASVGGSVQRAADVRRDTAGQTLDRAVLGSVFGAKKGETVVAADPQQGYVVARLQDVAIGPVAEIARVVEPQRLGMRNNLFSDMGFAARNEARDEVKPTIDFAQARRALGLDPEPAAGAATPNAQKGAPAPAGKAP